MGEPAAAVPIHESGRRWWSLAVLSLALLMIYVDLTVVNVALPAIRADLAIGLSQLQWTVNAYALAFAVLLLSAGKLADFFGRRKVFLLGVAVFAVSSLACALAASGGTLIAARAAQGLGAACILPSTLSIISATFHPRERATAIGIWVGVSSIGLALGPLIGGALIESINWHWIFYVNVPIGAAGLVAALLLVPESRDSSSERALDLPGLVLSAVALSALTFALLEANRYGWTSGPIVLCLAAAAAGLIAFIAVELRSRRPMLDLSLFRDGTFSGANAVSLLSFFALFGVFFFVSIYLQTILGYSALRTGATLLPFTILLALSVPVAGRLTDRVGARWPMAAGMLVLGVSLLLLSRLGLDATFADLLPGLLLGGLGVGMTLAPASAAVLASVPDDKAGVASGVVTTFRQTGGVLGVAVMGAIFAAQIGDVEPGEPRFAPAFMGGFEDALVTGGVVAIAGGLIAALTVAPRQG
ncbi:MAG TPA: MFS transporter [Gaiellaceae bacterium]|nr:MFS transporter [Gaiellaceae bacterium]